MCLFVLSLLTKLATYNNKDGGASRNSLVLVRSDMSDQKLRHVRMSGTRISVGFGKGSCRSFVSHAPSRSLPLIGGRVKGAFISGGVRLHLAHNGRRIFGVAFAGGGFSSVMDSSFLSGSVLRKVICGGAAPRNVICTTDIYCPRASLCIPVSVAVATSNGVAVRGRRLLRRVCRRSDVWAL